MSDFDWVSHAESLINQFDRNWKNADPDFWKAISYEALKKNEHYKNNPAKEYWAVGEGTSVSKVFHIDCWQQASDYFVEYAKEQTNYNKDSDKHVKLFKWIITDGNEPKVEERINAE